MFPGIVLNLSEIIKSIDFQFFSLFLQRMKASKCPSDELSLTNKAIVNGADFPDDVQ